MSTGSGGGQPPAWRRPVPAWAVYAVLLVGAAGGVCYAVVAVQESDDAGVSAAFLALVVAMLEVCSYLYSHRRSTDTPSALELTGVGLVVAVAILSLMALGTGWDPGWVTVVICVLLAGAAVLKSAHQERSRSE